MWSWGPGQVRQFVAMNCLTRQRSPQLPRRWREGSEAGYRSLRYRRGPDFLLVRDRRPGLEPADYTFDDHEARIYLACEDGTTAAEALAALGPAGSEDLTVDGVREFLDELVTLRLAYHEGGRYLALALPAGLPEHR